MKKITIGLLFTVTVLFTNAQAPSMTKQNKTALLPAQKILYKNVRVDDLDIFYRESGPANAPVILLMHGFPSSSFMFRDLIPLLNDKYRLIAPDYPGFGYSSAPSVNHYQYSFDNLSKTMERFMETIGVTKFSMYIQDYGAPVGLRLVTRRPEWLQCLIVQNGNAYEEGLADAWAPLKAIWTDPHDPEKKKKVMDFMQLEGTKFQYLQGVGDSSAISPDTYTFDQALLDRPGSKETQYELFYDYRNNVRDYPMFHQVFRTVQPPVLVVWGENDVFFTKEGALAYGRDIKDIEFNFYKTGHFALEEYAKDIADKIDRFISKRIKK